MNQLPLSPDDLAQLVARGISEREALRQLDLLRNPPSCVQLDRPCIVGDGVVALSDAEQEAAIATGRALVLSGRVSKFVPASGAATRMFQALLALRAAPGRPSADSYGATFFANLDRFPFARELRERSGVPGAPARESEERALLDTMLDAMGYAELPKGLIPFHRDGRPRTAFEDQLEEGVAYTRSSNGTCVMHFTVVGDARSSFDALLADVAPAIEARYQCTLDISFSEQHPSTDTLAVDEQGAPFRLRSGELLFRPSGHGALLDNLQRLQGDIIVIKNIDNILPPRAHDLVVRWKVILLGVLADALARADRRDRPVRVCGVVRNEGEPGGAPFWVRGSDGGVSPQIVESAQVNLGDPRQKQIFESSTHFNPVDLVCSVRDADGMPLDLSQSVDDALAFVSRKSHSGGQLTALERPGLWNGSMAGWETIFVEVPASTFAPVKTVFDLLRPQHQ